MKSGWRRSLLILPCLSLMLTSCWNSREMNSLAIVSGLGIDKAPGGGGYRVSFQIINPISTSSNAGAAAGEPGIAVTSATDKTLFGALRKASKKVSRQLFFAHSQLVIIGETLAKDGLENIFDIFERSHELRLNTEILVSRDTDAASILKILLPIENIPSIGLVKKSQNTSRVWGENLTTNIMEFINQTTGEGDVPVSGVRILGDGDGGKKKKDLEQTELPTVVAMSGLGVIKNGKLTHWVDGSEARGTLFVLNKMEETVQNINIEEKKEAVAVNIFSSKTEARVHMRKGVPVFQVHVQLEGYVSETKSQVDLDNREALRKLENALVKKTEAEVAQAVQAAQEKKSDIFNFGNELKRVHPAEFKKLGGNWDSVFAKGELDVRVEARIRNTGLRLNPYRNNGE